MSSNNTPRTSNGSIAGNTVDGTKAIAACKSHLLGYALTYLKHRLPQPQTGFLASFYSTPADPQEVALELLSHTYDRLEDSLHKFDLYGKQEAVKIFKHIMDFMGDSKSFTTVSASVTKDQIRERDSFREKTFSNHVIQKGYKVPAVRDEIFLQLCKQTTNNPNRRSCFRGWLLMAYCVASFPPSRKFEIYLQAYLSEFSDIPFPAEVGVLAAYCQKRLAFTLMSPPEAEPNLDEIQKEVSYALEKVEGLTERVERQAVAGADDDDDLAEVRAGESVAVMELLPDTIGYEDLKHKEGETFELSPEFAYQPMGD
eukprot:GFYU01003889.1.p1 GENE.GFYU01003889.1~~GFYU01003889.1.p1  ORF type:complete len:313 (-),score=54.33 GFYU01003889.1:169-1107(-)